MRMASKHNEDRFPVIRHGDDLARICKDEKFFRENLLQGQGSKVRIDDYAKFCVQVQAGHDDADVQLLDQAGSCASQAPSIP